MSIEEIRKEFDEEIDKGIIDWNNMDRIMGKFDNCVDELREFVKPVQEMEELLSKISSMAAHWWEVGREDEANQLEAYIALHQRRLEGKATIGIKPAGVCIGKTLTKVEKLYLSEQEMQQEGIFQERLILWFENTPMVLNEYLDSIVNPYYREEGPEQIRIADISAELSKLIGARLTVHHYTGGNTLQLQFDNGYILHFSNKLLFRRGLFNAAYYWIAECDDVVVLKPGVTSGKLYLRNGIYPGKGWRYYHEHEVFFRIDDTIYLILCDSKSTKRGLSIEELPYYACDSLSLNIEDKEFVFDGYGYQYHDGRARDIFFSCGEEILCLTCGHNGKVRMILLDKGSSDPANVKKEKGKEIHFVRE